MPKEPFLQLTRVLPARPQAVFDAWTDAEGIRTWFCPVDSMTHAEATLDVRVGGKWRIAMHGEGVYVQEGEYIEIDPPNKLVMTWRSDMLQGKETVVTVQLVPHGSDETELTLTHEAFDAEESRDSYEGGWSEIIRKLGETF